MQIHDHAKQGNIAGVAHQVASGVDINCAEKYFLRTPLMCAVASADAGIDMLQFLVENDADINAVGGEDQDTALGLAVKSGNLDKIRFLLDVGADIHYQLPHGYDVLISATCGPDISLIPILNLLIERGAKVTGVSSYAESALRIASRVGRFDAVKVLLTAGADVTQLEWTELMHAIAFGHLEEVKVLLDEGADLSARDWWERTPWLLSLQVGELKKAKLLLLSGANREDVGRCGKTPLMYAIENGRIEFLEWLIEEGFDIEATDEFGNTPLMVAAECGATDCVRILIENNANPARVKHCDNKAIHRAGNLEIVRILVAAGEDLSDINDGVRALLTGVGNQELQVSREQYLAGRYRQFGKANPEVMEIDFWRAMVRCGHSAYKARDTFADNDNLDEPVWCYQRFGRTITELLDGRIVEIAGEHEDYYDPDFCIYNDVVVYQGNGTFKILGYPKNVFSPTDFHTATLVGNYIYIIGNAGYQHERIYDETPVYRLHCDTFNIEKIETTGDKPGWISRHKAYYKEPAKIRVAGGKVSVMTNEKVEYIENLVDYILDLTNLSWSRIDA
ncbi:MAG: ankyrin repeat domain-containing protein [Drouetiella hepatica Uher 2000/2452]|jgi:ankyrin repeat protein|uniref:Ankyrin repeat domain-containing protein n=1 Tax=Drouetiella hepatica Uher 2000/2452 TaxID=904376 RepID=A0A951UQ10_9CYAN|nr:ankyrin repeat domain-containing protein [Drouetiella hepatica Uher 2000/2452]